MTVKAQDSLTVATFQICSTDSLEENYEKILKLINSTALDGVDLCVFPENALYISIDKNEKPPVIDFNHEFFHEIMKLSSSTKTAFHLGSAPIYKNNGLYNSTIYFDETGGVQSFPYDKIHLFAAQVGSLEIDEGKNYQSGNGPGLIEINNWKIGLSICFDLRFSELYQFYAKQQADLILVPSAFFRQTGKVHWEPLLKARAIESQAYVIAPGQVGVHSSTKTKSIRKSYGHSLVVDPWGEILEDFSDQEEKVLIHTLEKSKIEKTRQSIFMKRRL